MTFSIDNSVVERKYSEDKILAMISQSRETRKHLRKLGRVTSTVAAHCLIELTHLQAVEKLATWRTTYGFDRLADGDDSWIHGPHPPTPEQFTTSLWSDLNALKDAISMSVEGGVSQRAKRFIQEIDQGTVSFTDQSLPGSNGSWRGEAATRGVSLLRRLIWHSTVSPDRLVPRYRSIHV